MAKLLDKVLDDNKLLKIHSLAFSETKNGYLQLFLNPETQNRGQYSNTNQLGRTLDYRNLMN